MTPIRIDELRTLVTRVTDAGDRWSKNSGQAMDGEHMGAYARARDSLREWIFEQTVQRPGVSSRDFQETVPSELHDLFFAELTALEEKGDLTRILRDSGEGDGWFCGHPDVRPVPNNPEWGRCEACKDDSFPLTAEAAGMGPSRGDALLVLRMSMQAILRASTLEEAQERAKYALAETASEGEM